MYVGRGGEFVCGLLILKGYNDERGCVSESKECVEKEEVFF